MSQWLSLPHPPLATVGDDTATSRGVLITASGTANAKGSYTEITSSTAFDCDGFFLAWNHSFSEFSAFSFLIDLAIGAAASEQIIVPDLPSQNRTGGIVFIPMNIPSGTRVAARCQASSGSVTVAIALYLRRGVSESPGSVAFVKSYGATTANSGAITVDPGATPDTEGAYAEITSATDVPLKGFMVMTGSRNNGGPTSCRWLVDIAIGAASSEKVIVADLRVSVLSNRDAFGPHYSNIFWIPIPSGTRIAARALCDITDATDRLLDLAIIGLA